MSEPSTASITSVGVDWLTVTATWVTNAEPLERIGRALLLAEERDGNVRRPAGGHGYAGVRCGQVTVARRDTDVLVEVRSDTAAMCANALFPLAESIARCDVQMTLTDPSRDPQAVIWAGRWAKPERAPEGRPIGRQLIDDSRLGRTLYLGSGKSKVRGRVYDKHRESPDGYPWGSIRYELQTRDAAARAWAAVACGPLLGRDDLLLRLGGWFDARGVPPGLDRQWDSAPVADRPPPTDWDRALLWWSTAVAPNVARFNRQDRRPAILRALGLEQLEGKRYAISDSQD